MKLYNQDFTDDVALSTLHILYMSRKNIIRRSLRLLLTRTRSSHTLAEL